MIPYIAVLQKSCGGCTVHCELQLPRVSIAVMYKSSMTKATLAAQFFARCRATVPRAGRQTQLHPTNISIRKAHAPADDPEFRSIVDTPARLVRVGKPHSRRGILVLGKTPPGNRTSISRTICLTLPSDYTFYCLPPRNMANISTRLENQAYSKV